jgi:cbb3-type cytochrome oxidase cytochrome c subunit
MPDVRSGSIGFSEAETLAVVAYLQDSNGLEVTVEIPGNVETPPMAETTQGAVTRPKYASGEDIVAQLGCGVCHKIGGFEGAIGPDLSQIGMTRDIDFLRRAILNPNADITEGFAPMMPPVYGDQLYASELEMLVEYMANLR